MNIDEMTREELIEIVRRVPRTADGVPITLGMEMWGVYVGHENDQYRKGSGVIQRWIFNPQMNPWAIYSTREAARAALAPVAAKGEIE